MDLFNQETTPNLLPYDGTVHYHGKIFPHEKAQHYLQHLLEEIDWKNDEAYMFGKHIVTKRKVAWYGDENYHYTYSNKTKHALRWTPALLDLRQAITNITKAEYNSCLLNLYHNGDEGMGYHSDDEKTLGDKTNIASLTFGAERRFLFKHKTNKQTVGLTLEHGSLLEMKDTTQKFWMHRLPPTKKVTRPRVNLTFRQILQETQS